MGKWSFVFCRTWCVLDYLSGVLEIESVCVLEF